MTDVVGAVSVTMPVSVRPPRMRKSADALIVLTAADIVARPSAFAVTSPFPLTVATFASEVLHVTVKPVVAVCPFENVAVAVS
jgi:hypothetical protein